MKPCVHCGHTAMKWAPQTVRPSVFAVLQAKIEFLKKDLEHLFDDVGIDASQCVGH